MAIEQVTLEELVEELKGVQVTRGVDEVVLHHTWSPTAVQYRGKATWDGIRNYHVNQRGWSDIGYHYGIGPDGSIWKLRPVTRSGAHVLNRNAHTVGVAMIGNFDVEDPVKCGLATAAKVVRALVQRFKLKPANIRFHREFQNKTCPGKRMDLTAFRRLVEEQSKSGSRTVRMVDAASGEVVGSFELVAGGDHIADQGKVYVEGGRG